MPQNISEPLIQRVDVIGLPIVTYAPRLPGKTPERLSYFVDDVVKRALQGLRGVAQVERIGGVEREISVVARSRPSSGLGLTAADVSRQLRGTKVDVAGGRAEIGGRDQSIRTLAAATTTRDVAAAIDHLPVRRPDPPRRSRQRSPTRSREPKTFARVDGKPVVGFSVLRVQGRQRRGGGAASRREGQGDPCGRIPMSDLRLIDTSTDFTYGNYEAAIQTLFEGAALAVHRRADLPARPCARR